MTLTVLSFIEVVKDWFTNSSASFKGTLIVAPIVMILVLIAGAIIKKQDSVTNPSTLCVLCEWLVGWINGTCEELLGSRWRKFAPWIVTAGLFIFVANVSGMFLCFFNVPHDVFNVTSAWTFSAPTANVFITLALGLTTGFFIHYAGISDNGFFQYFKDTYCGPIIIFFPLNVLSELLTPLSLALRLFGNILSGGVIMGLIYGVVVSAFETIFPVAGVVLAGVIAPALHAIFDVFFGAIQTYVFMLLSTAFISNKLGDDDPNYVPIYN